MSRPTREDACTALSQMRSIPAPEDSIAWKEVYIFLEQCTCYLPSREAVQRDASKRRPMRIPIILPPDESPTA